LRIEELAEIDEGVKTPPPLKWRGIKELFMLLFFIFKTLYLRKSLIQIP
jgi:hypothetical protein